jgi:glutamate-1-semialdehyde aminotransferase/spore coat polysaccharide biosynthesis protein SpsF (cytidylyltransferase family)
MNETRVVALIQARVGSTRLPGKVLSPVLGRPLLAHQIERVKRARAVDRIVVATSSTTPDAAVFELAARAGVAAFAGSETDVLDRMYRAAAAHGATTVVRLTGDCPLLDPTLIDRCVHHLIEQRHRLDYVSTDGDYPDGLDVEAFSMDALLRAWTEAQLPYEREHVTPYIWQSGRFRVERLSAGRDLSFHRWTVDDPRDLAFVTAVFDALLPRHGYDFTTDDVLELLQDRPLMSDINRGITRNEGFLKSLREARGAKVRVRSGELTKSREYWTRAQPLIPAGTQTLSKGPTQFVDGVAPKYLARGEGSRVWDVDGHEYIDYSMALGAVILGHAYPATNAAIAAQLQDGITFSLMHPLEIEVAERLRAAVPCAEMVRFGKNGSDATSGAVRLARAYTRRDTIAHCGYHGWHDWYIASTTRRKGVPETAVQQQVAFPYNDLNALRAIFERHPGEIAAVIMEPYGATLPADGFLEGVKELAHRHGAVLVFDEVASGFRFTVGGVHQHFGVDPDLACFGKAMANGMPISALVGRTEIMRLLDEVFYSFTFGGECLSLAAARATLDEMKTKPVIPHLWELGTRLRDGLKRLIADLALQQHIDCVGLAPRTFVTFRDVGRAPALLCKSLFQQEAIKRGVLFTGVQCITYSHSIDDIEYTLGVYQEALEAFRRAVDADAIAERLEGRPIEPVFRPVN